MLPTDLALIQDEQFLPYVKKYAKSQDLFFKDFASAFGKLIALGVPERSAVEEGAGANGETDVSRSFRDMAMHGNLIRMKELLEGGGGAPDPNAPEHFTKRTALHKASYFGHDHVVEFVLGCGGDVSLQDVEGDTPLHDAARLGHTKVAELLLAKGAKVNVKNNVGETPLTLAKKLDNNECFGVLKKKSGLFGFIKI